MNYVSHSLPPWVLLVRFARQKLLHDLYTCLKKIYPFKINYLQLHCTDPISIIDKDDIGINTEELAKSKTVNETQGKVLSMSFISCNIVLLNVIFRQIYMLVILVSTVCGWKVFASELLSLQSM